MIRVRVVSTSPVLSAGLEAILSARFEISADHPDVIVTDDHEWTGDAPVVVLASDLDETAALLRAGARAVLPGDAGPQELAAAVEAAAAGLIAVPADQSAAVFAPAREPASAELTARELQVLRMIAGGLANKEIAFRLGIAESTAKFHVASILAKMGASSRTEAVTMAMRQGLVPL